MATPTSALATLVILSAIFGLLWPSCVADNILYSGDTLYPGQQLSWGPYTFPMQTDCNLVLYDSGRAVWASGTYGKGSNCFLRMQSDGNLVVYGNGNTPLWASNTGGNPGNYVCILQRDRNVVVYGPALWATGTHTVGSPGVIITRQIQNSTVANAAAGEPSIRKIAMVAQK
ncbi:mannose-specific lectin-like [Elaeis guineensis]|uniref:Mannose-specific lectin n=1 Tax=Elaeis guineensis var. tenera TaxID=51953 RepID=A0A6I9R6F6_ELAGV|nr:mannose-specific lectin [Elaeis guineensis]